jgi:predicted nucleic acid-binding protein
VRVFLDTNVLLDVLTAREPFYADSARVWTLVESKRAGSIAAVSVTNLYYIVRKLRGHAAAMKMIAALRQAFSTAACDEVTIDRAAALGMGDFEDAIQYVSALAVRADWLVTRNVGHFPDTGLPVVTPAEFLAAVEKP